MISFTLSEEQEEKLKLWKQEILLNHRPDNLGILESYVFIPHTLGVAVKVVYGEYQLYLTEYDDLKKK